MMNMKKVLSLVFLFMLLISSVHTNVSFAQEGESGFLEANVPSKSLDITVSKQVSLPNDYTEEEIIKAKEKYGLSSSETAIDKAEDFILNLFHGEFWL